MAPLSSPHRENLLGAVLAIMIFWMTIGVFLARMPERPRLDAGIGLLELLLILPFRTVRWQTVLYVVLFFGSTGGMIGVASLAGRGWSVAAILSFLIMGALAFFQRSVTGL